MNARMGAKPWLAHTQFQYAMLLERSIAADIERARILLDESETISRQLGMRSLETRIATASAKLHCRWVTSVRGSRSKFDKTPCNAALAHYGAMFWLCRNTFSGS